MASETSSKPPARRKSNTASRDEAESRALAEHVDSATKQYGRGDKIRVKSVKDRKLKSNLRTLEGKYKDAALQAKNAEILNDSTAGFLEPEGPLERTYKVQQRDVVQEVGVETAKKSLELRLDGLRAFDYTRNGRDLLIAGSLGHVASMDWRSGKLGSELQLGETVRDVAWLHNNQSYAVAQKKCVYIYANDGVELHQLKKHQEATHLQYLPYHYLLASVSTAGILRYTDTSTGALITELPTKLGPPTSFIQNPHNAILHVGHQKGLVTLWSPNSSDPLVKLLPHHGPVRALAIDKSGHYMASTGQDQRLSIWDIRMWRELRTDHLKRPGSTLSISDRNLLAVGWGTQVSIFKPEIFTQNPESSTKAPLPFYMNWGGEGNTISRVKWCPFEDILGITHDKGFSSIIVPGAGEPNFDALEPGLNPFETSRQRRETEIHSLLEKLQPEMISLDPNFIGNLDLTSHEQRMKERDLDKNESQEKKEKLQKLVKKGRGRNSALRRHLRKSGQRNVIDEEKVRAREAMRSLDRREIQRVEKQKKEYGPALERFASKRF